MAGFVITHSYMHMTWEDFVSVHKIFIYENKGILHMENPFISFFLSLFLHFLPPQVTDDIDNGS